MSQKSEAENGVHNSFSFENNGILLKDKTASFENLIDLSAP